MPKLPFMRRALLSLIRDARTETRVIYPWELPSIMRKHIFTGAMGTVYFVLLSGIYLVAFGNNIGMQYWQWGLLSGACSFALALQLASAYMVGRTGSRRTTWFLAALAARILRGLAIVVAFAVFGHSGGLARVLFVLLLVLSSCFNAIAMPPWFSWLADIVPREEHGQFIGRRSAWIALANLAIIVPIGYVMDHFGAGSTPSVLMFVFALGFLVGLLDLFIHRTIPIPPTTRPRERSFWRSLAVPLQDEQFRPWLAFNALWTFGMTLGGSLATIYFVENLGIKSNFFGGSLVLILFPLIGIMLTGRWVGTMVDRHGVKKVLRWGYSFWALLPLFWVLATPSTALMWLGAGALVGGVASGAALTASGKLVTRLRSPEHVPMYVAASTCVAALAGGMGPFLGGPLLQVLGDASWTVGGFTFVGFHILFLGSFLLRSGSTLLIGRIAYAED